MKSRNSAIRILIIISVVSMSFVWSKTSTSLEKKDIPAEYKNKENPYKEDKSLKMIGLRNFNRHCVSCHGKKGKGDGAMAKNLKTAPGDLTATYMSEYSDGELYYMSFLGFSEKPDFMKLIPSEEERWAVVNHVRSLSTK
jgi:mono/diheme cytochrome c family protein